MDTETFLQLFHASNADFSAFNPPGDDKGVRIPIDIGVGVFFSEDRSIESMAHSRVATCGGTPILYQARSTRPLRMKTYLATFMHECRPADRPATLEAAIRDAGGAVDLRQRLIREGYQAVVTGSGVRTVVIFDPADITIVKKHRLVRSPSAVTPCL